MTLNKTKIEYCTHTWNPVTGCRHGCSYCYARAMANRFGKGKTKAFEPEFHLARLNDPIKRKTPAVIFVTDMGDLFGEWVPTQWIKKVFDACDAAPQHVYLFLTKNPKRYQKVSAVFNAMDRKNWFLGYSKTGDTHYSRILSNSRILDSNAFNCWVSIEPMQGGPFLIDDRFRPAFIAVGAQTPYSKNRPVKMSWIRSIREQCHDLGIPLFEKDNLTAHLGGLSRVMEYPEQILEIMKERG